MAALETYEAWTNADWLETIEITGLDPAYDRTQLRARMQVRREASSTAAVLTASSTSKEREMRFVTDGAGRLALTISIAQARMAAIQPAAHVRDILIFYGGSVIHSGFGPVMINQGVTRD